jgi:hypothetical protein
MDSTGRIHDLGERVFIETALEAAKRRRDELEALARRVEAEGAGPLVIVPASEVEQLKASTPEVRRAWYAKKLAAKAARKRQREARRRQRQ